MLFFWFSSAGPAAAETKNPPPLSRQWVFGKIGFGFGLVAEIPPVRRVALDHQGALPRGFRHVRQTLDNTIDGKTNHCFSEFARNQPELAPDVKLIIPGICISRIRNDPRGLPSTQPEYNFDA